jgi:multidrug efflux pump subunit AcrA (membrane-fusion protein)
MSRSSVGGAFSGLLLGLALGAGGLWALNSTKSTPVEPAQAEGGGEQAKSSAPMRHVSLSADKIKAAQIQTTKLEPAKVRETLQVPATITLNVDRRVTVAPRVAGIVRQVDAVLGQKVKAGQRLALLECPDVGTARLTVRSKRFDLQVAKRDAEWRSLVAGNVEQLMADLAKKPEAKTLEAKYANKPLGQDRGMLLSTYAKFELARHEEEKQVSLFKKNLVGEHVVHQAQHGREGAQAEFESALEQTRFDVIQEKRLSDQKVQQAEVDLIDAVQRLRLLGVPAEDPSLELDLTSADIIAADWTKTIVMEDVAGYPILAAFDGTIGKAWWDAPTTTAASKSISTRCSARRTPSSRRQIQRRAALIRVVIRSLHPFPATDQSVVAAKEKGPAAVSHAGPIRRSPAPDRVQPLRPSLRYAPTCPSAHAGSRA